MLHVNLIGVSAIVHNKLAKIVGHFCTVTYFCVHSSHVHTHLKEGFICSSARMPKFCMPAYEAVVLHVKLIGVNARLSNIFWRNLFVAFVPSCLFARMAWPTRPCNLKAEFYCSLARMPKSCMTTSEVVMLHVRRHTCAVYAARPASQPHPRVCMCVCAHDACCIECGVIEASERVD